ncbi:hypothetical protein, partial [Methanoregula sp.]|uniref:hypothetical protein n=1 Tax=Methanoregula sp. TaxID=2052170 RepID=UPI0025D74401
VLFHDVPVRVVKRSKEAMFPVVDIAGALGYDRQSLHDILNRNSALFVVFRREGVTLTGSNPFKYTCLTRDGVIALLSKIDYLRIKDPAKRQRIIEFQRWAAETLGKVMDGDLKSGQPWFEVFQKNVSVAQFLHRYLGIDYYDAITFAISRTERETGEDLSGYIRLIEETKSLRDLQGPVEFVSTEDLARKMGCSVRELCDRLYLGGFTRRSGRTVNNLTEKGRRWGKEKPYDQHDVFLWDTRIMPHIPSWWGSSE